MTFNVERDAVPVGLLGNQSTTLTVVSGDTLYYADNSQVSASSNQGSLTSGGSATFTNNVWIVSASASSVSQSFTATSSGGGGGGSSFVGTALSSQAFVDMCAAPYAVTPGTDVTTALQTAINAANTANQDTTIFFSKPGVYNINGAQQTGSGTIGSATYSYSGQIVFPARLYSAGPISIRIMGTTPYPNMEAGRTGEAVPAGAVVLQSNATTGYIFDAIPSTNWGAGAHAWTAIAAHFEDISIRAPTNPQCGGVNGYYLSRMRFAGSCVVDTVDPSNGGSALTGTSIGVQFPSDGNQALSRQEGTLAVMGYPIGVAHSEHFTADLLYVGRCTVAVQPQCNLAGHTCVYKRLLLQAVGTGIKPLSTGSPVQIRGLIDIQDPAGGSNITYVVDDVNNLLFGKLVVGEWTIGSPSAKGFPVNFSAGPANGAVGLNLAFEPWNGRPTPWPSDGFTRISNAASTHFLGTTDNTHHTWQLGGGFTQSQFQTGSGSVKALNGGIQAVIPYRVGRAQLSRVVRAVLALVGTYDINIFVSQVVAGTNNGNRFIVQLSGGQVLIKQRVAGTPTTLAASAAAFISAQTYTVDVVVSNPIGGPYAISVYLNGTIVPITVSAGGGTVVSNVYQLSATESTNMTDTDTQTTQDGLFFNETTSSCTLFRVSPN